MATAVTNRHKAVRPSLLLVKEHNTTWTKKGTAAATRGSPWILSGTRVNKQKINNTRKKYNQVFDAENKPNKPSPTPLIMNIMTYYRTLPPPYLAANPFTYLLYPHTCHPTPPATSLSFPPPFSSRIPLHTYPFQLLCSVLLPFPFLLFSLPLASSG